MTLLAAQATLRNRSIRIGQETPLVFRIQPRARHNARADMRSDFVLVGVNDRIECGSIDQALFNKQGFERLYAKRQIRRNRLMVVIVVVFLRMLRLPTLWVRGEGRRAGRRALQKTAPGK